MTAYPAPTDTTTLNGMLPELPIPGEKIITTDLTLDAATTYLLKGIIVVKSGAKLSIPAGTVVRCIGNVNSNPQNSNPQNYATLLIERGGQIEILGTVDKPVVFTSAKASGAQDRGDWGGIVVCGKGATNRFITENRVQVEGFNFIPFDQERAFFGGDDNHDNSGIFRYLRIEFAGLDFDFMREANGLTLGAVGDETETNHIQVSFGKDDSFEWIGGAVNATHLISFKTTDDDFDTDGGYTGLNQFGIALRDSAYYDNLFPNTAGFLFSDGFESDNDPTGNARVNTFTNAVFSNYTMLGPVPVGSSHEKLSAEKKSFFRHGALIRRNSSLRIVNSIFMGYRNFLMIGNDSCVRNTNYPAALALVKPNTPVDQKSKQIYFSNNLIVNTSAGYSSKTDSTANGLIEVTRARGAKAKLAALDGWLREPGPLANNIDPVPFTTGTVLINPLAASTSPDFRPVANSPALNGANFMDNPILSNLITSLPEIQQAAEAKILVYPNPLPSSAELHFGRQVESFGIFDLNGRLLRYGWDADRVALTGLSAGIYIIKFNNNAQRFIVK